VGGATAGDRVMASNIFPLLCGADVGSTSSLLAPGSIQRGVIWEDRGRWRKFT